MAKPIFIIGVPELLEAEYIEKLNKDIVSKMKDYHVFVYIDQTLKEFKFQAFYEKDFDEVKFEELKQIIKDSVSNGDNQE